MTTLCGGGASAAKAGVAATIIFTAGSLSSLLNNKGGYWATLAAPLLGVLAYEATELCGTDPPAQPTISDAEYAALLQLQPWDTLQTALTKLGQIITRVIWFDMCECVTPPTPALPSNTLNPPSGITIPTYGGACPQPRVRLSVPDGDGSNVLRQSGNITRQFFPDFPTYPSLASTGPFVNVDAGNELIAIPPSWLTFDSRITLVSGNAPGSVGYGYLIYCFNGNRTLLSSITADGVTNAAPTSTEVGTFDTNSCKYLGVWLGTSSAPVGPGVVDVEFNIQCTPGVSPTSSCCSDPAVVALMGQLLQQVNLIQRQQVPFAYVSGASHAALSGSGELAVQGLLGARIELTTISQVVGVEAGIPEQTFEAGWLAWGNADGFSQREFLSTNELVSFPSLAGQYTRLAYNLPVGVQATIIELVREP